MNGNIDFSAAYPIPITAAAVLSGESGGSAATRRRNLKHSVSKLAGMSSGSSMPCAACLSANGARIRAGPFRFSGKGRSKFSPFSSRNAGFTARHWSIPASISAKSKTTTKKETLV